VPLGLAPALWVEAVLVVIDWMTRSHRDRWASDAAKRSPYGRHGGNALTDPRASGRHRDGIYGGRGRLFRQSVRCPSARSPRQSDPGAESVTAHREFTWL
jgi:hypothetical protein